MLLALRLYLRRARNWSTAIFFVSYSLMPHRRCCNKNVMERVKDTGNCRGRADGNIRGGRFEAQLTTVCDLQPELRAPPAYRGLTAEKKTAPAIEMSQCAGSR